jgi:hypothetical protein
MLSFPHSCNPMHRAANKRTHKRIITAWHQNRDLISVRSPIMSTALSTVITPPPLEYTLLQVTTSGDCERQHQGSLHGLCTMGVTYQLDRIALCLVFHVAWIERYNTAMPSICQLSLLRPSLFLNDLLQCCNTCYVTCTCLNVACRLVLWVQMNTNPDGHNIGMGTWFNLQTTEVTFDWL